MAKVETAGQELKKLYRAMAKLKNNLHRADLDYTVQISMGTSQPDKVVYAVTMTAPANGLAPVMFIGKDFEDLLAQVKSASKNINYETVEKAYHRAQILACENTKKGHEERLAELELPEEERGVKVKEPTKERPSDEQDSES